MLLLYLLVLVAASNLTFARYRPLPRGVKPQVVKHGMFGGTPAKHSNGHARTSPLYRRQAPNNYPSPAAACGSKIPITAKAPRTNIFASLNDQEAADVTSYLHSQKSLNLTIFAEATA